MIRHQLVIVGGGLAGLRAGVEAKGAGIDVAILSQVHPGRSHSGAAQGGINAALANNPEVTTTPPKSMPSTRSRAPTTWPTRTPSIK